MLTANHYQKEIKMAERAEQESQRERASHTHYERYTVYLCVSNGKRQQSMGGGGQVLSALDLKFMNMLLHTCTRTQTRTDTHTDTQICICKQN